MRVGIDCYAMQAPASAERGIGRYSRDLTRALIAAAPADEFVLYGVAGMPPVPIEPGPNVTFLQNPPGSGSNPFFSDAIEDLWGNPNRLDALLILSPLQSHFRPSGLVSIPRLVSVHYDLIPEVLPNDYLGSAEYRAAYEGFLQALRGYDAILTMSEHARQDLIERRCYDGRKVHAVGTDASPVFTVATTDAERAEDRARLRAMGVFSPGYILNVGHEDPRKGSAVLARAFARLPEELRATTRLVFAYNASEAHKAAIRDLAGQLGMPHTSGELELLHELGMLPQVHFTGWCDDLSLRALYRNAAVMCFPSQYEGFGLPLLEAMRCGCPVVYGDNSSQSEVGYMCGVGVDAADPERVAEGLHRVLANPELAAWLRKAGLIRASKFSWTATAQRALKAIRGD